MKNCGILAPSISPLAFLILSFFSCAPASANPPAVLVSLTKCEGVSGVPKVRDADAAARSMIRATALAEESKAEVEEGCRVDRERSGGAGTQAGSVANAALIKRYANVFLKTNEIWLGRGGKNTVASLVRWANEGGLGDCAKQANEIFEAQSAKRASLEAFMKHLEHGGCYNKPKN